MQNNFNNFKKNKPPKWKSYLTGQKREDVGASLPHLPGQQSMSPFLPAIKIVIRVSKQEIKEKSLHTCL